jgi:hypothetical protein
MQDITGITYCMHLQPTLLIGLNLSVAMADYRSKFLFTKRFQNKKTWLDYGTIHNMYRLVLCKYGSSRCYI